MKNKKIILSAILPVAMIGAIIGSGYSIWHFNNLQTSASNSASLSITNMLQVGQLTTNFEKLNLSFDQSIEGRKKLGIDSTVGVESAHGIEIFGYDKDGKEVNAPTVTYTDEGSVVGAWSFTVELKLTEDVISYIDVNNITNGNSSDDKNWEIDTTSTPGSIIFQCGDSPTTFDWSKITFTYTSEEPLNADEYSVLSKVITEATSCQAIYTVEKYEQKEVTCTFLDYNGNVLETKVINAGSDVTYTGTTTPTRASDKSEDQTVTTYTFSGWDKSLNNIICNTTFKPTFNAIQMTSNKDYIIYGTYPQSKVDDTTLIDELNTKAGDKPTANNLGNWTDYNYYISNQVSSYMYYIDIDTDNDSSFDYRGVYFTSYRARDISYASSTNTSWQEINGYEKDTIYWFKYEPIKWKVLQIEDDNNYRVITDLILDSQEYYSSLNERNGATDYNDSSDTGTVYANNYKHSNIRKFLNTTFINSAFTDTQQSSINTMTVDNSSASTYRDLNYPSQIVENKYACENTQDKMTLISWYETTPYGYLKYNEDLEASATDYAKCQGLHSSTNAKWWMRSPYHIENHPILGDIGGQKVYYTDFKGYAYTESVQNTANGVRPMCDIKITL